MQSFHSEYFLRANPPSLSILSWIYHGLKSVSQTKQRDLRSSLGVAILGLPLPGRSSVDPVVWKRLQRRLIVFWYVPTVAATAFWDMPAWSIPTQRSRGISKIAFNELIFLISFWQTAKSFFAKNFADTRGLTVCSTGFYPLYSPSGKGRYSWIIRIFSSQ